MKILNILLIALFIAIIITYAVLCSYTTYTAPNVTLDDKQKKLLYSTTIFGYLLGFILITIETNYLITEFNDNIIFRIIELLFILTLIFISYYSYIYQDNVNGGWGKVSSALWPLMIPMTMVSISCTAGIYLYFSNSPSNNISKLIRKPTEAYLQNHGGIDTSEVFIDTSEGYVNKLGGDSSDERKAELEQQVRGLIF